MIRKLAIALSLLGACFTGLVHALGLGEVTVKSALNQPLNAEIELVNTAGLTLNEILPGLATREEFKKANVDRVYFLSDLRFEVIANTQGKARIVLTSKKPVREPFLNFIVELIWPSGRLLREYALLIDPPLFSEQPKLSVNAPSLAPEQLSPQKIGDTLSVPNTSSDQSSRSIIAPVDNRIVSGNYGPTDANDTLWDIAIKARPNRSVSPQQVMLAIQDLNPNAFINNNINKLKAGQVLRLPTNDQIKNRSQQQAIQLVIAQNEANAGKRSPSVAQGSKSSSTPKQNTSNTPSIVKGSGDQLKLVVPNDVESNASNSANSGNTNNAGSGNDTKLAVTLEKLDKASIENKELNGRVSDLEEQLSTLQRLLTLKNDQLASIQSQMRSNELEKAKAANDETVSADMVSQSEADSAVTETSSLESANEPSAPNETVASNSALEDGINEDNASIDTTPESLVASGAETEAGTELSTTPTVKEDIQNKVSATIAPKASSNNESQNVIQIILSNPIYLGISIIIILVLVIALWLVSRHNAKREEEFHAQNNFAPEDDVFDNNEDNFDGFDEGSESEELEAEVSDYNDTDEDSLSEMSAEESQDILAEAEAYVSYGRLDQASQIIEKAISQDPVRADYRLKLLSIYKELGDRQAFDRQFSELEAIQDHESLSIAESIRQELTDEEALEFDANDNLESSYDLKANEEPSLDEAKTEQVNEDFTNSEDSVDTEEENKSFDFDSVSLEDDVEEELDLSSELDLDSLNSESSELDGDLTEALGDLPTDEVTNDLSESLSIVDDIDETELSLDTPSSDDDFDDSILDVDLDDLDLNAELDQESEIDLDVSNDSDVGSSSDKVESAEDLVVSDDILEEATQEFENDSDDSDLDDDLTDSDEFDFLNGTDEASTKLDLARAYIDMGDTEGAKDILLEVTKEGSEAQQAEAQELIDSID